MTATPAALRDVVLAEGRRQGLHRVGVAPIDRPARYDRYRAWLDAGMNGTMDYMAAPHHLAGREDPRQLAPRARSAVVAALAYPADEPGTVARYARGADYHPVLYRKLEAIVDALSAVAGRAVEGRICVDSAPVLERELAERAGLGFVGKNTLLIAPGLGSYTVLGEALVDVDVATTGDGSIAHRCGSCRACLDACPTGAFPEPWVLDARRCISYQTIEHHGAIPAELRDAIGDHLFGCDVCQEVCPFNAAAPARAIPDPELSPRERRAAPDLLALLGLNTNQHRKMVAGSPLRRVRRDGLQRNACVALGNAGDPAAIPGLERALAGPSALVRAHAAWALGRLGATAALRARLDVEADPDVRAEIERALG